MFYLPLLEPHAKLEDEDDDDFLDDAQEEKHVDLVSPFKKSIKQIFREVCSISHPLIKHVDLVLIHEFVGSGVEQPALGAISLPKLPSFICLYNMFFL